MTGIPVPTGGPPQSMRAGVAAAMQPEPGEGPEGAAEAGQDPAQELTEIEGRIVRLEETLISRGVLTEGDLTGPVGSDASGALPPPDPNAPPPGAPAPGAPPAPGGGY